MDRQPGSAIEAVSEVIAREMARNVRRLFKTDHGIAITGIAGPRGGTKAKPVGLVYIAVSSAKKTSCKGRALSGTLQAGAILMP